MLKTTTFFASLLLLPALAHADSKGHDDPKQDYERYTLDDDKAPNPLEWKLPDGRKAQVAVLLSFGHAGSTERVIVTLGDQVWELGNDELGNDQVGGELKAKPDGTVLVRLGPNDRMAISWDASGKRPLAKPIKK